ncbi:hypothetical protein BGV71_19145 [Burkholderia ubonensis]|uniref:hypothetical protein n=1 Tax=Burkholderia ubonensis TaxID=101571 RepID=UPI00075E6861|nr:hypothetical protein [Burkholderia ubonensis]KWB46803.1 hypothetical protein WL36_13970 [Burkholderia ubonensis]OJA75442.1 hypothetical protein BGV71_19145 [Burkholderia ubonensis]
MARKLTKKTLAGQPFERRQQVEVELAEMRKLRPTQLLDRLRGSSRGARERCSVETMIALIRDGQPEPVLNELVSRVLSRFSAVATHKLKLREVYSQEALENVNSAFGEALAFDITTRSENLDFFEVAFSKAVAGFIHSEVRREKSRRKRYVSTTPTDDEDESASDDTDAFIDVDKLPPGWLSEPERGVLTEQLLTEIGALPEKLRKVAILLGLGVQKESIDPSETTIADECQIKRRAVQYRQDQVVEKLANFKE